MALRAFLESHDDAGFPVNNGIFNCRLNQLSRTPPPPLPGEYAVGDRVFFTGDSKTTSNGDKLTHGQPDPASDSLIFGEGVSVMFLGNKGNIGCPLTTLSRTPP